ncbi:hypothetical protein UFOVP1502_2 [uncultured Caudovirales phage]|uniref:Concanavalin A-like lectin/glucanases superfamily n=1 Tax=uncultured Caudovirales phage TaxID=2100421 RepID=A0A6J5SP31_9CAUD|nr:hypothetical protein UFOVP1502_2 [uncultured Caudovirales phage]
MTPMLGIMASGISGHLIPSPPVSGYELWLNGKDATKFTFSSGSVVSSWLDSSGNGHTFSQATVANQPSLTSNLVVFDGTNDALVAAAKFMDNLYTGPNTLFIVYKVVSYTAFGGVICNGEFGSGGPEFGIAVNTASNKLGSYASGTSCNQLNTMQTGNTLGLGIWDVDLNNSASTRAQVYLNAGTVMTGNTQSSAHPTGTSLSYPTLAASNSGTASYSNIAIGEIIWYKSSLGATDRNSVRDFLMTKWGL